MSVQIEGWREPPPLNSWVLCPNSYVYHKEKAILRTAFSLWVLKASLCEA
ncbi:MAG: hypothetical protein RLZZ139_2793 [Cyanobacteriota bacterium]|jgi:hypothetical protein